MRKIHLPFFVCKVLLLLSCLFNFTMGIAEEKEEGEQRSSNVKEVKEISSINVTEVIFNNGMKVLIKPTNFDANEVFVQAIASGGYASAGKDNIASAFLAAKVAKESGLGFQSIHKLNYDLYRDSIEFSIDIEKNLRTIEVTGPSKQIDTILGLVEMAFLKQNLTKTAFETVLLREKSTLTNRQKDRDNKFEVAYLAMNTQNEIALQPITLKDLEGVSLEKIQQFYKSSFTNPEDFSLIIVGDVDPSKTIELIDKHLGSLKNDSSIKSPCCLKIPAFPEAIKKQVISAKGSNDAYGRMTFLLNTKFSSESVYKLELMTLLFEKRLREVMLQQTGKAHGIDVGYQLPLFPYTKPLWITITYHSRKKDMAKIEQLIMETLNSIQNKPLTETQFQEIKSHLMSYDEYWQNDNSYWQASLANYSLWGWDFNNLGDIPAQYKPINKGDLEEFIKNSFATTNYTLLQSEP